MPRLVVITGPLRGKAFELQEGRYTIGRAEDNSVCIAEDSVSSHHGELVVSGENFTLRDVGSTNGTRVNGGKLESSEGANGTSLALKDGDQIEFGYVAARFETGAPRPLGAASSSSFMGARVRADEIGVAQSVAPEKISAGFQKAKPRRKGPHPLVYIIAAIVVICVVIAVILVRRQLEN